MRLEEREDASGEGGHVSGIIDGSISGGAEVLGQLALEVGDEVQVLERLHSGECPDLSLRRHVRRVVGVEDADGLENRVHLRAAVAGVAAVLETVLKVLERLLELGDVFFKQDCTLKCL